MPKRTVAIIATCMGMSLCAVAQSVVPSESSISFAVSNLGVNTVRGSFDGPTGEVKFDPSFPEAAAFSVRLPASTVVSGVGRRDTHLKSEDFFDIENHPYITVESSSVRRAEAGAVFLLEGTLTIKGISHPLQTPFKVEENEGKLLLSAQFEIERAKYRLGDGYGSFVIGKTIEVNVMLVVGE